jgi:4-amino-4-deoxy-L-arabinose transferase-like glycosyltransferase
MSAGKEQLAAPAPPEAPPRGTSLEAAGVACILAAMAVTMLTAAADKCVTYDESAHSAAGLSYWLYGDYRLNPENGVLPQRIMGLALLAGGFELKLGGPNDPHRHAWQVSDEWRLAKAFHYEMGNDSTAILSWGRAGMTVLPVLLGALVYAMTRRLFGVAGAMVALLLFALDPTMLANGPLMTSDMAAGLLLFASAWACWRLLERVTWARLAASTLATGASLVAKPSGMLVVAVAALLLAAQVVSRRPIELALWGRRVLVSRAARAGGCAALAIVHVLVAYAIVWSCYGWRYAAMNDPRPGERLAEPWGQINKRSAAMSAIHWARAHRALPEAYLYGVSFVVRHAEGRRAFLAGRVSNNGFAAFFPFTFAAKTPPASFVICGLAAIAAAGAWKIARRSTWTSVKRALYATAPCWALLAVYWPTAIASGLNIGHRHLLPVYAPMFVLCGSAGRLLWGPLASRARTSLVIACLVLTAVEMAWRHPSYLSYFTPLLGGPSQAHKYLADSSIDWGQDLPALKRHIDARRWSGPVYLQYGGMASPEYHGIKRATGLVGAGLHAVTATVLSSTYEGLPGPWNTEYERLYRLAQEMSSPELAARPPRTAAEQGLAKATTDLIASRLNAFLRHREPTANLNGSILVFELSEDDVGTIMHGPPAELELFDAAQAEPLQLLSIARQYSLLQRPAEALDWCAKAVEADPEYAAAYSARAVILYKLGRNQDAWRDVHRCIELGGRPRPEVVAGLRRALEGSN